MLNISCQQLIDDLQHIQELKKKCDVVLGTENNIRKNKIDILIKMKKLFSETYDTLFVDVEGNKLIYQDYVCALQFTEDNKLNMCNSMFVNSSFSDIGFVLEDDRIVGFVWTSHRGNNFSSLKNFRKLKIIHLQSTNVSRSCFSGFKLIETLMLYRCDVESWDFLSEMKSLKSLDVRYDLSFTDQDLLRLLDLPNLEKLDIRGCPVYQINVLLKLPNLKEVSLSAISSTSQKPGAMEYRETIEKLKNKGITIYVE